MGHSGSNYYPSNPEQRVAPTDELTREDVEDLGYADGTFALYAVYGGGNQAAYTPSGSNKTTVTIYGCRENTIKYVYGGGCAADSRETEVIIEGGRIYQVYAGGNGSPVEVPGNPGANITGDASVTVKGGLINAVFGGSNTKGVVQGTATVTFEQVANCDQVVIETFGGGNEAPGGTAVVNIPCEIPGLTDVYGGARNANIGSPTSNKNIELNVYGSTINRVFGGNKAGGTIYGNVTVNIYGGTINEVFGGSNEGGNITGDITVNIDSNSLNCPLSVNYVYGGGNLVAYVPDSTGGTGNPGGYTEASYDANRLSPEVNLINGTVSIDVFGGGKGHQGLNPVVPVNRPKTQAEWEAAGHSEYWTSQQAYNDTLARYNAYQAYLTSINAAKVKANPVVTIGTTDREVSTGVNPNARVYGNVYGGGNAAPIEGNTKVDIRGNRTDIFGSVYGGGNAAKVTGNTTVVVGDRTVTP